MDKPRICAVITENNLAAIRKVEPLVDLLEVRIDLIGDGWTEIVGQLHKPWIACNRKVDEGGKGASDEAARVAELLKAIELGADMIDIELRSENLPTTVKLIKQKAKCLISFHDLQGTPSFEDMKGIIWQQIRAGADICKVVTTAKRPEDGFSVLQLIPAFPGVAVVAFAMGAPGLTSRILCPLMGGAFTYASIEADKESAPGQITAAELRKTYEMIEG
jgi:3-dehydroquinate dehydratase-1